MSNDITDAEIIMLMKEMSTDNTYSSNDSDSIYQPNEETSKALETALLIENFVSMVFVVKLTLKKVVSITNSKRIIKE